MATQRRQGGVPVSLLLFVTMGIFIIFATFSAFGVSDNSFVQLAYGQQAQSLKVLWEGKEYDLLFNSTAEVQSIDVQLYNLRINLLNVAGDGEIEAKIPLDLAKSLFYPDRAPANYESLSVFVDGRIPKNYGVAAASCESLIVSTDFVTGSEQVLFAASTLPSNVGASKQQSGLPVTQTLTLPEGEFQLDLNTDALRCDLSLIKEEKRLHVDIAGGTGEAGFFQISVPHEILGGNYTVMVDSRNVSDFNATSMGDSTIISTTYPVDAKAIDIIGTTVIPEFPLPVLTVVAAMAGAIVLARLRTIKERVRGDRIR